MIPRAIECAAWAKAGATWWRAALVASATLILTAACVADDHGQSVRPQIEAEHRGNDPVDAGAPVEPDVETTDLGFAEDGADPAPFDRRGLYIGGGPPSAGQSELGTTESAICLSIEIGLDELADGAATDQAMAGRRVAIEARAAGDRSIDPRLMSALRVSHSGGETPEAALTRAMARCQELGYQR